MPAGSVHLLLKLGERRLYMLDGENTDPSPRAESFPVAVGRKEYATPIGRFEVKEKIENPEFLRFDFENPSRVMGMIPPGPNNPLGARWIGFTSKFGWKIGFHGTPHPELLGQAVSHGCVRMRNDDIIRIYDRVAIGTVVIVRP